MVIHDPHIEIRNATMGYRKRHAVEILRDVNLNFKSGDFVGIAGLNGTGKSTLIKSLCGLIPLLGGEVLYDGRSITEFTLGELARKVAIVLTEKIGGFNLTVADAVSAGQMPYTNSFNQLDEPHKTAISAALASCGMTEFRHVPLTELSDGMFQKTMIARALAQQTPFILLDEPSAFLDYASRHNLFGQLKHLAQNEHKCVLLSSHDLDLILKYCNKIALVSGSHVKVLQVSEARTDAGFLEIGGGFI